MGRGLNTPQWDSAWSDWLGSYGSCWLEVGTEAEFKLDLRQDRDPGKQKLKGAVRTETHRHHYCQQIIFIIKIPVYCYFLDIFHGPLTDTRYYPVDNLCSVAPLVFLNRKTYLLSDLFWRTWQGVIFSAHSVCLFCNEYTKLRSNIDLLDLFNSDKIILKCHETIFFIE
jgi:hypothetical protein